MYEKEIIKLPSKNVIGKMITDPILEFDPDKNLENLLELCRGSLPSIDENQISKAFQWCVESHSNKLRKSGKPFYTHPLSVARIIVNEMPLDDKSVVCALLHDVMDYSNLYSMKDIRSEFGPVVSEIVDGISKIRHIEGRGLDRCDQLNNYQKLLLSMFKDVRIILIKLADRLHNMRTIEYLPRQRQKNIAKETLEIYSRFAHRFGLWNIKWELEDLSFKTLDRKKYDEISNKIHRTRREREIYVKKFTAPIIKRLGKDKLIKKLGIKFEINGRPKHIYSTYSKLLDRKLPFEEINDLYAFRIILDTEDKNMCLYAYGAVCEMYKPVPGTFKNYIYTPKKNGYQSIHTAVVGLDDKNVEVQFRTRVMHEVAERGVAAHFKYKKGLVPAGSVLDNRDLQHLMDSFGEILENAGDAPPQQLMESVRQNIFQDEIYVFTPKNELKMISKDSTPLDFAFKIHTEIGLSCIGAKVNGSIVPLDYKLRNGDQVMILTSKKVRPSKDWLGYTATSRAKSEIHKYLKQERIQIERDGERSWNEKAALNKVELSGLEFDALLKSIGYWDRAGFFIAVGSGKFDLDKNMEFILFKIKDISKITNGDGPKSDLAGVDAAGKAYGGGKVLSGISKITFAPCCNPLPGDEIVGLRTLPGELTVHRRICKEASGMIYKARPEVVEVDWAFIDQKYFFSDLRILADDRSGLLNEITSSIISCEDTNIRAVSFDSNDAIFDGIISLSVKSLEQLKKLIDVLYNIGGVKSVERISSWKTSR